MKKRILAMLVAASMVMSFTGCAKNKAASDTPKEKENVSLTVWGAEEDQAMLTTMIEEFKTANADSANFNISLGVESESTAKDTILKDVEAAADVFAFADDQINQLSDAGALQEVIINTDKIIEANGGKDAGAVKAASINDKLYAYPMTADNGYFMFYNKEYFTEDDVQSLDKMLEAAATAGKKMTIQIDNAWYIYSFFQGAGLSLGLEEDGKTNHCNWNSTDGKYTGVQVAEAIAAIAANPGFVNLTDAEFATGLADGSIIAGVNGTWNAETAQKAWGDNYAATKLPTFTVAGDQVQMSSFAGYKLIGVNAYSKNSGWAMKLGEWLTNYDNQVTRFETRGIGPSNVEAAASEEVQTAPAIAALSLQSAYATVQRVGDSYWTPAESFGAIMVAGNPDKTDYQTLLDTMVQGFTAPVAE